MQPHQKWGGGKWQSVTATPSNANVFVTCYKNERLKLAVVYLNTRSANANFTIDISNAPALNTNETYFAPLQKGGYLSINSTGGYSTISASDVHTYEVGQIVYPLA